MSPRSPVSWLLPCTVALAFATSCKGGGGDDEALDPDRGSVGVGADGVTIFWWYYGDPHTGWGTQAREMPGGGFVACGAISRDVGSFDAQSYDAALARMDAKGGTSWELHLGLSEQRELANDVVVAPDGSLLVVGEVHAGPSPDILYARVRGDGSLLWLRSLGGDGWDSGQAALAPAGGGFLLGGMRSVQATFGMNPEAALIRLDGDGTVLWERHYGDELGDELFAVVERQGGGFAFAGRHGGTPDDPGGRIWLARTDEHGALLSERTYGDGCANGLVQMADGGFALTGYVPDGGGAHDLVVLRIDSAGNELWRRTFGGADYDVGRAIDHRADGGLLVAGYTQSFTTGAEPWQRQDILLLALDGDGKQIWQQVKGKAPDSSELADSIVQCSDGGMILAGAAGGEMLLMKADALGHTVAIGDLDVSLDVPDLPQGTIGFTNAAEAAQAAVGILFTARQVGPFALEQLSEVLAGTTPAEYCELGGGTTIVPPPTQPLAGGTFEVEFASCATASPEPRTIDGGYTHTVEAASADIQTAPFEIAMSLGGLAVDVLDAEGLVRISGSGLAYERSASSSSAYMDGVALVAGAALFVTTDGVALQASQLELEAGLVDGVHRLGPATARVHCPAVADPLEVWIDAASALRGVTLDEPSAGALTVRAPDSSALVLRALPDGRAELALDTNGDGVVDLTLPTTWSALY